MTTLTDVRPIAAPSTAAPTGVAVVGAVLALNAAALGTQLMFGSAERYSQIADDLVHLVHYVTWTLCLLALTQLIPRLRGVPGTDGRTLPEPVLVGASVTTALLACVQFTQAFVSPYLAGAAPDLLDSTPSAIFLVPVLGAGVIAMVGMAALGVVAWRRGVVPLPAAALLVVGGLAIPALGPVSNVLLGAGLIWLGTAGRRRVASLHSGA